MPIKGVKDRQSVIAGGARGAPPKISGVRVIDLGNVITRSGWMSEIFRVDWPAIDISVRQVNWVQLNPGAVTDWHAHERQTDHIVAVGGNIKLALWDARDRSPSRGVDEIIRLGAVRPAVVVVPPGIYHGLRNESGAPAGYIVVIDELYDYADPDNWRASPKSGELPDIL